MAFLVNLNHDKKTRRLRHQNFFRTVSFHIQCFVFHFCGQHYLDSIGAVYRKRIELLGDSEIAFLSFGYRGTVGSTADNLTFFNHDLW